MKANAIVIPGLQRLLKQFAGVALVFFASAAAGHATLLYSQLDNQGPVGAISQNYSDFPTFSSQTADDFVISGQIWIIDQLYIPGGEDSTGNPSAQPSTNGGTVEVSFYEDNGGLPGTLYASLLNQTYSDDSAGDLTITLGSPVNLSPGTWWLSVVVDMAFDGGTQWFWGSRSVQTGNPAAWQNPGNGYGTGYTTWGVKTAALGSDLPDQVFEISGEAAPIPEPTTLLLLGSGLVGLFGLGRRFRKADQN